ncbi:ribokinase [Granulicella sibirica]|uniref:Ribokinase n=1 Tax=Granulicella sibirica TaxID=2479048 RepID=A0A4Q0T3J7_9BACT|nr:ribokinase [Granulicella sibirica]RXH58295.1 Ribokinase [Granulicella sibirica]
MSKEIVVVGSLNLDMVARVPRNPQVGETITGTDFQRFIGGKGANQAVAAALLGGRVHMVGRHGTDGFETGLLATLREKGVGTEGMTPAAGPSGVAVILVTDEGHNSIVVIPGSNGRLCAEDVSASRERIAGAGVVLTQLETPLEALEATVAVASEAGVPVVLDPAPARALPAELLAKIDWITPNETEAALLLGGTVPSDDEVRGFAERLLGLGPKNVVLKLGERGAYLATASGVRELVPAIKVKPVDSTAAGDALNGAFAAALMRGADALEAVRFGVAAASLSVTRAGAIPSLPTLKELEAFRLEFA